MIIDSHVHIGTDSYFQINIDADELAETARAVGFDKLFITHLTALEYDPVEGNDACAAAVVRYPDLFIGYATVPLPRFGRTAVDEIRRCYEKFGFRGIKTYSRPEASMAPIPESLPLFELAAELKMPVLVHATPEECDFICSHVPEAWVNMAHMGGHPWALGDWHKAVAYALKHKNLFLDTASSQIDNGMLEYAVSRVGAERIIFGSDTPLLDPWVQAAKVRGADLDENAKALIMGGNMARLLELS